MARTGMGSIFVARDMMPMLSVVGAQGLTTAEYSLLCHAPVCLFVLRLNVPVNNFSVMSGRSHRFLGN